ncbi:MAG: hypothetical protein GX913_04880 [Clostridiales bacterium]|nr:hypothetical protein [Clostridiales bacterium]
MNPNQKVTIIYDVEETITKEFTLAISDLDVLNLDEDLEIDEEDLDREITITLAGYKSVLDQLESEDLRLSIDLIDLTEGRHVVEVKMAEIQGIDSQILVNQPLIIYLMEQ